MLLSLERMLILMIYCFTPIFKGLFIVEKTYNLHSTDWFRYTFANVCNLERRPVYHRKEERIRAHVLLCWLSLLLVRITEVNTKQTWPKLRSELEDMHLIEYESTDGNVFQRTELTEGQKRILFLLEIPGTR